MKKFFTILFSSFCVAIATNSQSVSINTDGTTADASAILDVKSTTKGFMMPRVTSAQRTGIVSPSLGLLVFDTDTKTIWAYNGNAWTNLTNAGGGGSFSLPFSQTINMATSALQITNQGPGAAIEGISSAQLGVGITARATGEYSWGLNAVSTGAGSQAIRSYAENGIAFHGENSNPANTYTLMNLMNKGAGKTGSFQLANNSSTSPNVQIAGNHLGEQLKIYQTNAANGSAALLVENSGTGTAIRGDAFGTNGIGIYGAANSSTSFGVEGVNTTGAAIFGYSVSGQGVVASSINGVGLRAGSTNGTALEVNGNVKIAGGNTSPGAGKVLTSDVNGIATWKGAVAFKVRGNSYYEMPEGMNLRALFENESYDLGNDYDIPSGAFTVPEKGLYHFDASVGWDYALHSNAIARIMLERNGSVSELAALTHRFEWFWVTEHFNTPLISSLSTDAVLLPGDKIYVSIYQNNPDEGDAAKRSLSTGNFAFNGHLVTRL